MMRSKDAHGTLANMKSFFVKKVKTNERVVGGIGFSKGAKKQSRSERVPKSDLTAVESGERENFEERYRRPAEGKGSCHAQY